MLLENMNLGYIYYIIGVIKNDKHNLLSLLRFKDHKYLSVSLEKKNLVCWVC